MASLLDTLFPSSPPPEQGQPNVRFPGGSLGTKQHETFEVRDAKNRMHNTIFRARRKRAREEREMERG